MRIFLFSIAILLPTLAGLIIVTREDRENFFGLTESLALSFSIGAGLLSLYLFLIGILGLSFSGFNIAPFFVLLAIFAKPRHLKNLLISKRDISNSSPKCFSWQCGVNITLLILIICKIIFIFIALIASPTYFADAITHWNYMAKVIFFNNGLNGYPNSKDFLGSGVISYPLGVPIFKAWIALVMGQWVDQYINLYSFLIFVSLLIILYSTIMRYTSTYFVPLLSCYLIASLPFIPFHVYGGYSDIIVGYYFTASLLLLALWFSFQNRAAFSLSAILIAIGIFVKREGIALYLPIITLTLSFYLIKNKFNWGKKARYMVKYLAIVLFLTGPWLIFWTMTFTSTFKTISPTENNSSIIEFHPEAIGILLKNNFAFGTFNIIWVTLVIVYIVGFNKSIKGRTIFLPQALLSFSVALFPYIFSHYFIYLQDMTVINRALLQIIPFLIFTAGIFISDILTFLKSESREPATNNMDRTLKEREDKIVE